ncbi:MAG: putative lipid II flippase FtsW [Gammaproteobacteria bacterium]|nr:putative lipid II flippase FtsW [Gammaproteobacteria bacterium]
MRHSSWAKEYKTQHIAIYDRAFVLCAILIVIMGLVMVASSSMIISAHLYDTSFHYLFRQLLCVIAGAVLCGGVVLVPLRVWEKYNRMLLVIALVLLALVLVPGLGRSVNGSRRWLHLGPLGFQVSEIAKLFYIVYLASYLHRFKDKIGENKRTFILPLGILALTSVLLLLEPDFGSAVVIAATTLGLLFLGGVQIRYFILLIGLALAALAALAVVSPYRLLRLTSFLNPWADQFGSGYQLTQSLIAFGRGGIEGVGLGQSIQKLFYLPEAHTDFLFAVLGEELGLIGMVAILLLYTVFFWRVFVIGHRAYKERLFFGAFLAYGLGLWLFCQVLINMGVNVGLLPTKGLTLPLMSYGGSSLLTNFALIGLILRVDHEMRVRYVSQH